MRYVEPMVRRVSERVEAWKPTSSTSFTRHICPGKTTPLLPRSPGVQAIALDTGTIFSCILTLSLSLVCLCLSVPLVYLSRQAGNEAKNISRFAPLLSRLFVVCGCAIVSSLELPAGRGGGERPVVYVERPYFCGAIQKTDFLP